MKRLTCEMCGSTDLMKQDGVFVCQSCGTKYSVEEAKKMMVEGTVEVTGTVRVDDSAVKKEQINNYLEMAKTALDGEDIEGVVSYCDRILEIDRDNYEAWILKAKAAGWGSTLKDIKVPQALTAAKRAVNLAPDSQKYEVASEVYYAIKAQVVGLLVIAQRMPGTSGCEYILKVMQQWQSVLVGIPYLSKNLMEKEIKDCQQLCENSKSAFAPSARLIYSTYFAFNHNVSFDKTFRDALADKIKLEESREAEFKAKAEAEAEARKISYWNTHAAEKTAFETEKVALAERVDTLTKELEVLPENSTVKQLESQIATLKKEKDSLGLFKGKEKKAIQEQIDSLNGRLTTANTAKNNAVAPIQAEIDNLNKRIKEIETELTKDR